MPAPAQHADALRIESAAVEVQHLVPVGTIPGVEVLAVAARNGPGVARLRSEGDGTLLAWRAPGSESWGLPVPAGGDGDYLLEDGEDQSKWARVQVYADFLAGPMESRVLLADRVGKAVGSDDVTADEASAGDVETYTVTLRNAGDVAIDQLKCWLDAATAGLEISDDGIAWVDPTTEETALELGSLAASASTTLHLRRTIGAAAPAAPEALNHLHFSFFGD